MSATDRIDSLIDIGKGSDNTIIKSAAIPLIVANEPQKMVETFESAIELQFNMGTNDNDPKMAKAFAQVFSGYVTGKLLEGIKLPTEGMGKTAEELVDWTKNLKPGDTTPDGWVLTKHPVEQLQTGGRFDGKLTLERVDELINSKDAIRVIDSRSGNINVYVNSEFSKSSLLRITVPTDGKRIVSLGFEPLKRIENFINNNTFVPIK